MFPHCTMEKPFSGHFLLSPSLKLDSSFFPFPFPTFHQVDDGFNDIVFSTAQLGETDQHSTTPSTLSPQVPQDAAASRKKTGTSSTGRKRALRKDRHSKIRTAQGLRDRRMRLSLDVAPEFFDIQDMLGYDKASKTLRWLITAAKPAIQDLIVTTRGSSKSIGSSASELESGDRISTNSDNKGKSASQPESDIMTPKAKRVCRRPPSRRAAFPTTIARESRLKARERARERTEKKGLLQSLCNNTVPFEAVGEDSGSHNHNTSVGDQVVAEVEERCYHSPNQRQQLGGGGGRSNELAVTIFDYNQSSMCPNVDTVNLFQEQWYMEDIQLQTRLWEA